MRFSFWAFVVFFLSVGFIGRFLRVQKMRDCLNGFFQGCVLAFLVGLAFVAIGLIVAELCREFSGQLISF